MFRPEIHCGQTAGPLSHVKTGSLLRWKKLFLGKKHTALLEVFCEQVIDHNSQLGAL